jgi:hypothetical protein
MTASNRAPEDGELENPGPGEPMPPVYGSPIKSEAAAGYVSMLAFIVAYLLTVADVGYLLQAGFNIAGARDRRDLPPQEKALPGSSPTLAGWSSLSRI